MYFTFNHPIWLFYHDSKGPKGGETVPSIPPYEFTTFVGANGCMSRSREVCPIPSCANKRLGIAEHGTTRAPTEFGLAGWMFWAIFSPSNNEKGTFQYNFPTESRGRSSRNLLANLFPLLRIFLHVA